MIISHKHKYLFIEVPHTASTAISQELLENYNGVSILHKHATYNEFLKQATPEEKQIFVFRGVRNPLDETISKYFKFKTNHKEAYTNPKEFKQNGGWVTAGYHLRRFNFIRDTNADFPSFFKEFYKTPYYNQYDWSNDEVSFIIRFEHLQEDFSKLLKLMGVKQVRPLPLINKTSSRRTDFASYYPPKFYEQARYVFGPFMKKWEYDFPVEWGEQPVPWLSRAEYFFVDIVGRFCTRWLRWDHHRCNYLLYVQLRGFSIISKLKTVYWSHKQKMA